ncbi:AMP-binding protein [Caulobacter sp. LARHSG274]
MPIGIEDSYDRGLLEPPLLDMTIAGALDAAVLAHGDSQALVAVHQNVRLTWSGLRDRVDAFAAGLVKLGVTTGDRVGVWAPNCVEWTIAQFATARVGAIQVNINPAYRTRELAYTLKKVGVKVLICTWQFKSSDYVAMVEELLGTGNSQGLAGAEFSFLQHRIKIGGQPREGWLDFADVEGSGDAQAGQTVSGLTARLDPSDPINIQFTSGTTGSPKAATLSHHNILNNAYLVGLQMGLRAGDRLCIPVPLYHCFGMVMGNLACLAHGATMIYPSEAFDPLKVLQAIQAERCTGLHGVPTMFIAELEHPQFDQFDLSSLRTGIMAGATCPVEVMRKVVDRMHMGQVGIAYGMTETSPVSFQTSTDDPLERRISTIGRVQPHLEVKIVDPETGVVVPRGTAGELCTKGYAVMLGYWDDAEKTAEVIRDGWMHTGDLAVLDAEGYGAIVGRIKDMVIRGGENIYPREIEEFLFSHPLIADVQVVGVPDRKYGEEICAWIKLRAGATPAQCDIPAFCAGRIAHYKIPRYVRFVDSFPMTVTGKVQKFEIREAMIRELAG